MKYYHFIPANLSVRFVYKSLAKLNLITSQVGKGLVGNSEFVMKSRVCIFAYMCMCIFINITSIYFTFKTY